MDGFFVLLKAERFSGGKDNFSGPAVAPTGNINPHFIKTELTHIAMYWQYLQHPDFKLQDDTWTNSYSQNFFEIQRLLGYVGQ